MAERLIDVSPYAALWKSSIWRIQLVSGFHLGQIWATILRSRFARASDEGWCPPKLRSVRSRSEGGRQQATWVDDF